MTKVAQKEADVMVATECAKAAAHFATISVQKVRDLRKIAMIVSRQTRRGSVECLVACEIAKTADKHLAARAATEQ